jgi:hypothetical protein
VKHNSDGSFYVTYHDDVSQAWLSVRCVSSWETMLPLSAYLAVLSVIGRKLLVLL